MSADSQKQPTRSGHRFGLLAREATRHTRPVFGIRAFRSAQIRFEHVLKLPSVGEALERKPGPQLLGRNCPQLGRNAEKCTQPWLCPASAAFTRARARICSTKARGKTRGWLSKCCFSVLYRSPCHWPASCGPHKLRRCRFERQPYS